jgi:glycosyltransferase involved in cell wall biosynthesis
MAVFGLVVYGDIDTPTGGYLYDRMLVNHLEERGHEVEIISQERLPYLENIRHNFSWELVERVKELSPDLLLEDELNHISLFESNRRLREEVGCPMISIVHHLSCRASRSEKEAAMFEYFESLFLMSVDGFLFNSQATRESVEELVGRKMGVVAHPGKDHLPIEHGSWKHEHDTFRMLFVGNVLPHKGLDILVSAVASLDDDAILDVVGSELDREYLGRVGRMIVANDLTERVVFHGHVPRSELEQLMIRADVLVVPSFMEGYGIVYAEALGYGLPIVATTAGGAREVLTDDCGILVEPGNVDKLSEALAELMDDPTRRARMGEAARERYRDLPRWSDSMEIALNFLVGIALSRE